MSTDPRLLSNAPAFPTRVARPGERLWSMCHGIQQIDAELRSHGDDACELQLLRDGDFYSGRRFNGRAQAMAHGEKIRQDLTARGWQARG
jgi:hypothetical protein